MCEFKEKIKAYALETYKNAVSNIIYESAIYTGQDYAGDIDDSTPIEELPKVAVDDEDGDMDVHLARLRLKGHSLDSPECRTMLEQLIVEQYESGAETKFEQWFHQGQIDCVKDLFKMLGMTEEEDKARGWRDWDPTG